MTPWRLPYRDIRVGIERSPICQLPAIHNAIGWISRGRTVPCFCGLPIVVNEGVDDIDPTRKPSSLTLPLTRSQNGPGRKRFRNVAAPLSSFYFSDLQTTICLPDSKQATKSTSR